MAVFIAFIMLFVVTSENYKDVVAQNFASEKNINTQNEEQPVHIDHNIDAEEFESEEPAYIEYEDVMARDINKKQYQMSDGTVLIEQFAEPVHYKENGIYKEIDNSLIAITDKDGEEKLKNAGNNFDVVFRKKHKSENDMIKISKEGYEISFSPVNSDEKQKEVETIIEMFQKELKTKNPIIKTKN